MAPISNNPYKGFSALANTYRNDLKIVYSQEKPIDYIEHLVSQEKTGDEGPVVARKSTKTILNPNTPPTFSYHVSIDAPWYFQAYALEKAIKAFEQPIGGIGADASSCLTLKKPENVKTATIITFPEILTQNEKILEHLKNMFSELADSKLHADGYNPTNITQALSAKIGSAVQATEDPCQEMFIGVFKHKVASGDRDRVVSWFKTAFRDAAAEMSFSKDSSNPNYPMTARISFPKVKHEAFTKKLDGFDASKLSPQAVLMKLVI